MNILRNWRHYEGLQKHQEKVGLAIKTIDDLKISDFNKDAIPNIKNKVRYLLTIL